jgi:hypothetical protein
MARLACQPPCYGYKASTALTVVWPLKRHGAHFAPTRRGWHIVYRLTDVTSIQDACGALTSKHAFKILGSPIFSKLGHVASLSQVCECHTYRMSDLSRLLRYRTSRRRPRAARGCPEDAIPHVDCAPKLWYKTTTVHRPHQCAVHREPYAYTSQAALGTFEKGIAIPLGQHRLWQQCMGAYKKTPHQRGSIKQYCVCTLHEGGAHKLIGPY